MDLLTVRYGKIMKLFGLVVGTAALMDISKMAWVVAALPC